MATTAMMIPALIWVSPSSGRRSSSGSVSVRATPPVSVRNGPFTSTFATAMPMKDIISVVMISLTPYQARSTAGTTVHSAPTRRADGHHDDERQAGAERVDERRREPGGERRAEQELPVGAQVPEVRPEGDDQPGRDQQQRRHPDDALLEPGPLEQAALEHVAVELERVAPEDEEHQPGGDEREQRRHERRHDGLACASGPRSHRATISSPTRSSAPGVVLDHPGDRAARHDRDPVAERDQLVDLGRDEERRRALLRPARVIFASHELGGAHVEPVGRLVEDHDPRRERQLAREHAASGCCRRRASRCARSRPAVRTS